jgi:glucose/arabinose dehydrogenase
MRRISAALGIVLGLGAGGACTDGSASGRGTGPAAVDGGQGQADGGPRAEEPLVFDNGGRSCSGQVRSAAPESPDAPPPVPEGVLAAPGFAIEVIASVGGARQIAALPNGDLLVGTSGSNVVYVPRADAVRAGAPIVFASSSEEAPVQGITFHEPSCNVFVATQFGIYRVPYEDAQASGQLGAAIARVRDGGGGGHSTTSVAVAGKHLFAGVGSSCNACTETDPTRATVQRMNLDGSEMVTYARRIRNPIAFTTNPVTRTLWAGNAGQDGLPEGHPYEFFDAVTAHPLGADYGWPDCEENNVAYAPEANCAGTVAPRVVLPAYSTLVGAAFYPTSSTGEHAFPPAYRGSALVVARGAWHKSSGGGYFSPPRVVAVSMTGDAPNVAVDWKDPSKQWTELVTGFETADRTARRGRPTGIAVGRDGSVYVGDDTNGYVYRIRPSR